MKTNFLIKFITTGLMMILAACGKSSFDPLNPNDVQDIPSVNHSSLSITPNNIADGLTPAEIIINVKSASDRPIAGVTMILSASGSGNVIVPCTSTDNNGLSRCKVYSTASEKKLITASGGIVLTKWADFIPPNPLRSSFGIVATATVDHLSGGQVIISTSGITEHNIVLKDSTNTERVFSSILGDVVKP